MAKKPKTYFQIRSKFGVRTLVDTEILSELILSLKQLDTAYSVFTSANKIGPWKKVEGVYNAT